MKRTTLLLLLLLLARMTQAQAGWCIPQYSNDSSTLFINGYRSTIYPDYVLATKGSTRIYLFYPVSIITTAKPDSFSVRRYFWNQCVQKLFSSRTTDSLLTHEKARFGLFKGIVTDKRTGTLCYITTGIVTRDAGVANASAAFVVYVVPYHAGKTASERLPERVAPLYDYYNRFMVRTATITGHWEERYYLDKYNPDTTHQPAARITRFQFNKDSTFQQEVRKPGMSPASSLMQGRYELADKTVLLSNPQQPAERFECWLEVANHHPILHLDNKNGQHYKLININP